MINFLRGGARDGRPRGCSWSPRPPGSWPGPTTLVLAAAPEGAAVAEHGHRPGGEVNIQLPDLNQGNFLGFTGHTILLSGLVACVLGLAFGLATYVGVKKLPVHRSMAEMSELIYETCKAYLIQQGKLLLLLELFIGVVIVFYFVLTGLEFSKILVILLFSLIGMGGSYGVAWYGIRINTLANSRTAFASLTGKPFSLYEIPLRAGMSVGMMLISVELLFMLAILLFIPSSVAGAASSGSPSASRSARRRCESPAASSRRSPTSGPT